MNAPFKNYSNIQEVLAGNVNQYLKDGWVVLQTVKKFDDGEEYSKCLIGAPVGVRAVKRLYSEDDVNKHLQQGWKLEGVFKSKDYRLQFSEEPLYILIWDSLSDVPTASEKKGEEF